MEVHDTEKQFSFDGMFKGTPLYTNESTLYYIKRFQLRDTHKIVITTGFLKSTAPNIPYRLRGHWVYSEKYKNWQIKVDDYRAISEDLTESETIKYLSSDLFKGIGPSIAARIYEKFGDKSISIVENEPEKLIEIKGLSAKKVALIEESFKRNKYLKFIISELGSKGVSFNLCQKIYNEYEEQSMIIIKEKPYSLAYDIEGIGFKKADDIALTYNNIKYHDIERVKAAIFFSIKTICEAEGHTYVVFDDIVDTAQELLNTRSGDSITFKEINDALTSLCEDKRVVLRDGRLFLMSLYKSERDGVKKTIDLVKTKNPTNFTEEEIKEAITWYENKNSLTLADNQKEAITKSLSNSFSLITGYPGTGKSFTIKGIIEIFKYLFKKNFKEINKYINSCYTYEEDGKTIVQHRRKIDLTAYPKDIAELANIEKLIEACAPTGKAAKRIEESTGYEAQTIHRLLKVDGQTKTFIKGKNNPISAGLVIVDEVSMVDTRLYASFINAIKSGTTKVILVGDPDQLPSVGPGNVLHDLLEAEDYIPTTRLDAIFRQKGNSNIVLNSKKIREYKKGVTLTNSKKDFQMYYLSDDIAEESIYQFILNKYKEELKEYRSLQILTPARKETVKVSSTNLNPMLSQIANAKNQKGPFIKKNEKTIFHENDKVIQTKNNYSKGVFNGDTGIIKKIKDGVITIDFNGIEADYLSSEEFDLSYAMTVHRSQGSEFDCVIVPVLKSDTFMLNKSLIYTAITRAKKKVVLIAHKHTLDRTLLKLGNKRNTLMAEDLKSYYRTGQLPNFVQFNNEDVKKMSRVDLFKQTEDYA